MLYYKDFKVKDFKPTYYIKNKGRKNEEVFCDNIITLDTEVTSYYIYKGKAMTFDYKKEPEWYLKNTTPQSVMYIWMVGIEGTVIYGRTNSELREFLTDLTSHIKAKTFIYIHNLSYDFNFILNALGTNCELFARKERKPMKVFYPSYNLELRCSLFLTNKSLKQAAKDVNAPIEKLEGDLDYNIIRTPLTPLTDKEKEYCKHDILCMAYIILDKLNKYTHIANIPLTQTGQVRRAFKKALWGEKKYIESVKHMWPDYAQFKLLAEAYYGGYVHSNHRHTNKIIKRVYSYDITSSYPYVLTTNKFPIKKFVESYEKDLNFLDYENYAYIIDITLTNVKSKIDNTFLSIHKALPLDYDGSDIKYILEDNKKKNIKKTVELDNGRIKSADKARFILTDQDLMILNQAHTFRYKINNIYTAKKEYLPAKLINFILQLFKDKTRYKNVKEFESKYKEAKEFINSVYGMFVTKIISDTIIFENGEWITDKLDKKDDPDAEANKILFELGEKDQFTSYSTGVWVAAYARKHLWDLIIKMDKDVVYCDTDSIKFINEENIKYFEEDNRKVDVEIFKVCQYYFPDIDPSDYKVEGPDGKIECLGYFEAERTYHEFRTLGAKKYAFTYESKKDYDKIVAKLKKDIEEEVDEKVKKELQEKLDDMTYVKITVAGVNKQAGAKYFRSLRDFAPATFLGYEYAGKKMVKYNDSQEVFIFEDGYIAEDEKYGCVLTPTTYLLNITKDYKQLLEEEEFYIYDNYNVGSGTDLL